LNDDFQPAGFGIRLLADFLDFFILVIPISLLMKSVTGEFSYEWTQGLFWNVIYTIYLTITPVVWGGYIIGKRICKIKVTRIDNKKLNLYHMFLREWVGKFLLPFITFGITTIISIFMVIFRKDKRAIHDFLAGTYVSFQNESVKH
jgi:uncharacterized RDD family membrane protein YckC